MPLGLYSIYALLLLAFSAYDYVSISNGVLRHIDSPVSMKKEWVLTQEAFEGLLASLDVDRELAGQKYERVRLKLIKYFQWRGAAFPDRESDETINRVARRIEEGEMIQNINAYFYGVARLVFTESLKEREREREVLNRASEVDLSLTDYESETAEQHTCLDRCLRHLPEECRNLVIEYYQDEKSSKIERRRSLASRLDITLNALRIRAHRIRIDLEECLRECLEQHA